MPTSTHDTTRAVDLLKLAQRWHLLSDGQRSRAIEKLTREEKAELRQAIRKAKQDRR